MTLHELVNYPAVRGALSGILAAATVDIHAFQSWKTFDDAKQYSWSVAAFRWCQGAVLGALTGVGLGML